MQKQRIPPSEQIRQQIDEMLDNGMGGQDNLLGTLVHPGARLIVQEALERETTEQLGRAHYQHRASGEPLRGYRNGYEPGRLRTAEGEIPVKVPQVRDWVGDGPYQPQLMAFLRGHSDVLERLAAEMYARGLSTRDIEATGEPVLSRSAVTS
jgi:putative transposase